MAQLALKKALRSYEKQVLEINKLREELKACQARETALIGNAQALELITVENQALQQRIDEAVQTAEGEEDRIQLRITEAQEANARLSQALREELTALREQLTASQAREIAALREQLTESHSREIAALRVQLTESHSREIAALREDLAESEQIAASYLYHSNLQEERADRLQERKDELENINSELEQTIEENKLA